MNLQGKDFLKLLDFDAGELSELLRLAKKLKAQKKDGIPHPLCTGKQIALIFEKTSTRTRCSFEVAARDLGMGCTYLDSHGSQIGKKESIADTARVLSSMYDGIEYRGFGQKKVEELAKFSSVPVWNGLTDEFHPTQILADFLTLEERFGSLGGLHLVYMGDARYNMGNSLAVGCAKMGIHLTLCAPDGYLPCDALLKTCRELASISGGSVEVCHDPRLAVRTADAIYTDVWVSMGEDPSVWDSRIHALSAYAVNEALMEEAPSHAIFLHCLPSFHNKETDIGKELCLRYGRDYMEVSNGVFEGPQSAVFQQAENRMHTVKAVMAATLCADYRKIL